MNAKAIFSVVLLILVAVSLVFVMRANVHRGHPVEIYPPSGKLSKNVEIDVFIDGSGSMRHFLEADVKVNTFREFLRNCEFAMEAGASENGWDTRRIRFWKFGPHPPKRLNLGGQGGEGSLREMAENPKWFDAPDTPIGDAFLGEVPNEIPDAGKLRIVITDLYESDGKLEIPGKAIGTKYLGGSHGAVAVYGVRNPFKGGVDDLPGHPRQALPDAATSMPFYILIAGENAADVRHAQALLSGGQYGEPLRQAAADGRLFVSYFSKDAGFPGGSLVTYDARVFRESGDGVLHFSAVRNAAPRRGEDGSAQPVPGQHHNYSAKVRAFEADHRRGISRIAFGHRFLKDNLLGVSWAPLPVASNEPLFESSGGEGVTAREWRVLPLYCETGRPGEKCTGPTVDQEAARGVYFCGGGAPAGQSERCQAMGNASLAVVLDRQYFRAGRDYLLEFDLVGGASTGNFDAGGSLMHRWSLGPDEVYDLFARGGKFPADGVVAPDDHPGKTPNLTQLMNALNGYVLSSDVESNQPGAHLKTFYLYLSAR